MIFITRTTMAGPLLASVALIIAAAPAPASHEHVVTMANMSYGSLPSDLHVGDTIIWQNRDTVPHTVTARDHSFNLIVPAGKSAPLTLKKAGSIPFYCIYHATMRGTLTVAQ